MSSSIMLIKETSVSALTEALERYMREVVGALAKEYDFDQEAGLKMLGELKVEKEGKSRGVKTKRVVPKIIVPFCGIVQDEWCKAVRYNGGLFTQCTNACKKDSKFCTTCLKHVSVDGIPQYGLIEERGNDGWTGPNGKVPVNYGNIMSKIGVTKEQAIAEAEKLGWTIPEEQFEVVKTRKGRPAKKAKETTDEKPKKRGRPKKSKPVVEGAGTGDDLIAQLVQQAQQQNEVVAVEETEDEEEAETPTTLVDFGSSSEEEEAAPEVEPTQSPAEQTEVVAAQETEDEESPAEQTEEESTEDEAVEKKPKKVTRKKKTAEEKEAEKLAKAEAKAKLAADKKAAKEAEKEAEKLAKAEAKAKLIADKKAAKEAEKEAEKLAKAEAKAKLIADKKAIKEAEKKATMLAKKLAKAEAEKLAKAEAEKLAKAEAEKLEPEEEEEEEEKVEEVVEELGELTIEEAVEEEEEEEDAVEVIKFTHEGVEYLRDADNTVYDMESQEEIGEWDDESKTITFA